MKKKDAERKDWREAFRSQKVVINERHLRPDPHCNDCGGRGYLTQPTLSYCYCLVRQIPKAEREATTIVLVRSAA